MEAIHDGDLVKVKTNKGTGLFVCQMDGIGLYLQEVEPGTVRKITGHGGSVMPARPTEGVTFEKANGKQRS